MVLPEVVDRRVVAIAALIGAIIQLITLVLVSYFVGLALSMLFVAIPVGVLVGLTTEGYHSEFKEGGFAALGATLVGVIGYGVLLALQAGSVPLAYRFDAIFISLVYAWATLVFVGPVVFVVGGWVAHQVATGIVERPGTPIGSESTDERSE